MTEPSLPPRRGRRRALLGLATGAVLAGSGLAAAQLHRAPAATTLSVLATPGRISAGVDPAGALVLPGPSASTDASALAAAESGRRSLGLPSDPQTVQQLLASRSADPTYGVPLTPSEKADIAGRAEHADAVSVIETYAADHAAATYAGVYAQDGGTLVVSFIDKPAVHAADLAPLLPSGTKVTYRQVAFSADHLRSVESTLLQRLANSTLPTNPVTGMDVDVLKNRVAVSMTTDDAGIRALLADDAAEFVVTG